MKQVKMHKSDLIEILTKNREIHRSEFEEAWVSYKEKAIEEANKLLAEVESASLGDKISFYRSLSCPEDHTEDYDRSIEMLNYEVEDLVVLTEGDFARMVQDDWDWRNEFSSAYYNNTGKLSVNGPH